MWTVSHGSCFSHKLISTTEGSVPESFGRDGGCEIRHARRWLIIDQDVVEGRQLADLVLSRKRQTCPRLDKMY